MSRRRATVLLILIVVSCCVFIPQSKRFSFTWARYKSEVTSLVPSEALPYTSKFSDNRINWTGRGTPQTTLQAHTTGWSVLDSLYAFNGTLYVVTDDPTAFPPLREMICTGIPANGNKGNEAAREPTDADMRVIDIAEATRLFGYSASRLGGVTLIIITLPPVFIGFWRTYSSLDLNITSNGDTVLPPVSRMIFPHAKNAFHDHAGVNQVVLRAAFPSIAFEYKDDWIDRASTGMPIYLDRVVLTSRSTIKRHKNYQPDAKMISVADHLPKSPYWWSPIRRQVLEFVKAPEETIALGGSGNPVITYISRQNSLPIGGRKLTQDGHRSLVDALLGLEARYGYEVNIVEMEKLSKAEQFKLAGRTTIMIGVHGNGLSSLLWMRPSPIATVIEIYFPPGFSADYAIPARILGIEHYGVWGDRYFRTESEHRPKQQQPDGFHRDKIPADGPTIAALCVERINHPTRLSSKI
ncbi:hypothetical protein FRB98_007777 [Tulasnella sp. 332]|nr:hypothetical protein FRB98_007777 [Tulasnella sp. 332]